MLSSIKSMALNGLEGYLVDIQTDISKGLPNFEIVGLPDTIVKEAKERIKVAIRNSKIEFPSNKILINLAPANIRKAGSMFDLPMAIGILIAKGEIPNTSVNDLAQTIFIGELSLDGKVNRVNGILAICMEAKELGIKRVILPKANEIEAAVVEELEIIAVRNIKETQRYLNKEIEIKKTKVDIKNILILSLII